MQSHMDIIPHGYRDLTPRIEKYYNIEVYV